MKLKQLKKKHRKHAKLIMDAMAPIDGERRVVQYCDECDQVMGARYIPHALGRGFRVNTCLCRLTGNERIGRIHVVMESSP